MDFAWVEPCGQNQNSYPFTSDLNCLSCGWMKFEAGARLAYSIEIFGEGECTQEGYLARGQAFAEGIAEFYGQGAK